MTSESYAVQPQDMRAAGSVICWRCITDNMMNSNYGVRAEPFRGLAKELIGVYVTLPSAWGYSFRMEQWMTIHDLRMFIGMVVSFGDDIKYCDATGAPMSPLAIVMRDGNWYCGNHLIDIEHKSRMEK